MNCSDGERFMAQCWDRCRRSLQIIVSAHGKKLGCEQRPRWCNHGAYLNLLQIIKKALYPLSRILQAAD
jgi:hypothetical protein